MYRLFALFAVLLTLSLAAPSVAAQDASPAASPAAGPCEAPELPPGTPTPLEEEPDSAASPSAEEEAPPEDEGEGEGPPAAPMGTPADAAAGDPAEAAIQNLFNCINSGDYLAVAALLTNNFIQNFIEVPTVYDVPASFEGVQPIDVRSVGNAQSYEDGSVSVDGVYTGLFNGPGSIASTRWTFVEEEGILKLDGIEEIPLPEGALPGAVVIDVQMVDYAFALSEYTVPANTPVIFRTTNRSAIGAPHVNVILTYPEGTTTEGLIEGEADIESSTGFLGAVFLLPGQTGDIGFESIEPGTYFLLCDVETEDGTPHFELGMVAQVTVK
ncbi:MAG: hypothetical protein M3R06_08675 [Chloroflexota bacterium]|nr:hypothetical protein [Chloroflexota bacterium]